VVVPRKFRRFFGSNHPPPVNYLPMRTSPVLIRIFIGFAILFSAKAALSSAYNAHPKLVVVIVIDQFRGDYLERYRDQFGEGGFRLFLDRGAYFPDCYYDYANTRTAPGHATLFSGAYSNGHGIISNEWWDPVKKKQVTSVEDDSTKLVGIDGQDPGASPHNLQASTLGDELKLATQGRARVFGISLKDRAAILPAGFSGDGAYWIDKNTGAWITSTYYQSELPTWVKSFNDSKRAEKYLNKEWKDSAGNVLRTTAAAANRKAFYDIVGSTPFANDYELEFARELVLYEHLGAGPATDLLSISLSANDILGHEVGPDSPQMQAMALALDRQLADFFTFLGQHIGMANVWVALSADHGVAPLPATASKLRIPAANLNPKKMQSQLNAALNAKLSPGRKTNYIASFDYPLTWINDDAFAALKMKEEDAERAVGEATKQFGLRGYFTRAQLARGEVPDTELARKYLHAYAPTGSWYVMGIPAPFAVGSPSGTDHASPYSYDTHVPLAFYGLAFQPGTYYKHAEPIDLAVTFASLLGINPPSHATGRVLREAIAEKRSDVPERRPSSRDPLPPKPPTGHVEPASLSLQGLLFAPPVWNGSGISLFATSQACCESEGASAREESAFAEPARGSQ
jgi:predicted AlkP superfamily pyrophosphatase or phosphodiesterase